MNVLVTGGAGCLGTPLVRRLACSDHHVRVSTLFEHEAEHLRDVVGVTINTGRLSDRELLRRICDGIDIVYHLAGKVHVKPRNREEEAEFFDVNTKGTVDLIDACRATGVRRIVFFSTVAVYGETNAATMIDETTPTNALSAYARSKLEAEQRILDQNDIEGVVLRFPVAYGPRDRGNIGRLIAAVARRRFFWVRHGANRRSLINSRNVAEAAYLAGTYERAPGEIFIATDEKTATLENIIAAINKALDRSWTPPNISDPIAKFSAKTGSFMESILRHELPFNCETYDKLFGSLVFSCEKSRKVLGYRANVSLEEGIAEQVNRMKSKHMI